LTLFGRGPTDVEIEYFSVHVLLKITVKVQDIVKVLTFKCDEIELPKDDVLIENRMLRNDLI
jgi:hypothetical protein